MREIYLTNGMVVYVDNDDFEDLNRFAWRCQLTKNENRFYAVRTAKTNSKKETELMHRRIAGIAGLDIDHIDGNGLNNQRSNLRPCTRSQNLANRGTTSANKTGYKGVRKRSTHKSFEAVITFNNRSIHLGSFDNAIDAARAYDKKAVEVHGEFAKTNEHLHHWLKD
jgi:hypothetical protein